MSVYTATRFLGSFVSFWQVSEKTPLSHPLFLPSSFNLSLCSWVPSESQHPGTFFFWSNSYLWSFHSPGYWNSTWFRSTWLHKLARVLDEHVVRWTCLYGFLPLGHFWLLLSMLISRSTFEGFVLKLLCMFFSSADVSLLRPLVFVTAAFAVSCSFTLSFRNLYQVVPIVVVKLVSSCFLSLSKVLYWFFICLSPIPQRLVVASSYLFSLIPL